MKTKDHILLRKTKQSKVISLTHRQYYSAFLDESGMKNITTLVCSAIYDPALSFTNDFSVPRMFTVLPMKNSPTNDVMCRVLFIKLQTPIHMPQTVDWWVRIALTLWKYIFGKPKSAKFEIWFVCYSYHEEVEKTAFDRRLQAFQGYFEDNIFYQKS